MANDKLSAKEAALLAQVRAELAHRPAGAADAGATAPNAPLAKPGAPLRPDPLPARAESAAPPMRGERTMAISALERVAPAGAEPATSLDPAERVTALIAAARAETERLRQRQKKFYLWVPLAVISVTGLWSLLWMWHRL